MKVWIVVQHYDSGSDEFCVEGVFSTPEGAVRLLREKFVDGPHGWRPMFEDGAESALQFEGPAEDWDCGVAFYADPEDEHSDHVWIEEHEVDPA